MVLIVATDSVGNGVRYSIGAFNDLIVRTSVEVISNDSTAIVATGSNQTVEVRGFVEGRGTPGGDGVRLGEVVADTGNRLINSGVIRGDDDGVQIVGLQAVVSNSGVIFGSFGVFLSGTGGGTGESSISNSGSIVAGSMGLYLSTSENVTVENDGFIFGSAQGIVAQSGRLTLVNTGRIVGEVRMGSGDDAYDGRGGSVIGLISGENDNDRFVPGLSTEDISGGSGFDALDFRSGSPVRMSLDGSLAGTGAAAGDTYAGIESVLGSNGNDTLVGDAAANTLRGSFGADFLNGKIGNDLLGSGPGADTVTGGTGNDVFQFLRLSECGDRITDFGRVAGNNDRFEIDAAAFGGGLTAGALSPARFVTRADNLAQDANDRFIFRTTDRTLWFDANGSAAGGLTLVADLQPGAIVTAADIILV